MDFGRVFTLLKKDVRQGAGNFLMIYVLVMPIVLALLVSLVFGDLFAQTPRLGIYDAGGNESFTQRLLDHDSIDTTLFESDGALQTAVSRGTVEFGLSLPVGFSEGLTEETIVLDGVTQYQWGEINARNFLMLESAISRSLIDGMDLELTAQINPEQLGTANTATWAQRLLPLLLVMAVVLGGLFIPASSLVEEKEKGTLVALTSTPTSLFDVYMSKTLLGVIVGALMAVVMLVINQAVGGNIALLLLVIALGALMNAIIGIIMGSYSKNMDSFMGMIKVFGLLLYAPGILDLFPAVPEWVSRIFPTYYIMNPVLEISQNSATLGDIALDLGILVAIVAVLLFAVTRVVERQHQQLALAS